MATTSHQTHPFPPLYDSDSRILMLGSFPSIKSREGMFFYHHPQNRFWRVLASILSVPVPQSIEEKSAMLHQAHIALWDVIASCEIESSSDSSIRDVQVNDLSPILSGADIQAIFCNGATSYQLYSKHLTKQTGRSAIKLPSTSPANAAWSLERLCESWSAILQYL